MARPSPLDQDLWYGDASARELDSTNAGAVCPRALLEIMEEQMDAARVIAMAEQRGQ